MYAIRSYYELFETVTRVEEELAEVDRTLFGRDRAISGSLRFTSTEIFINGYLGRHVWGFLRKYSRITSYNVCYTKLLRIAKFE